MMNERIEHKLVRVIQLYQLVRLRKLLHEPSGVLAIQERNPNSVLLEDAENTTANQWKTFLKDHDLIVADNCGWNEFAHVSSSIPGLDIQTYQRMVDDEDDPVAQQLIEQAQVVAAENDGCLNPDSLSQCYLQDTFRQGFYKGRFHARL
ncbi:hypothetical protein GNI_068470 [Gregarina niphandrodes]|uniref:Uncharacterized protein n=1 Tax=Gregarina niphandrodes TaxID=110365 RepID=A0A023B7N6_GRENI|nr:hypothetical protein GNI_068470 [Gregarina niphandrodes]EZG67508.1 hypothetical protein GNI_068470 [Gregarina niphandrodes]|eukprot:XP_011130223.1 hypothetical protein GNI_068470 [Gregarina niphandrodes]